MSVPYRRVRLEDLEPQQRKFLEDYWRYNGIPPIRQPRPGECLNADEHQYLFEIVPDADWYVRNVMVTDPQNKNYGGAIKVPVVAAIFSMIVAGLIFAPMITITGVGLAGIAFGAGYAVSQIWRRGRLSLLLW